MARVIKQYGRTTPKCFFCEAAATTHTDQGISVCPRCKDKNPSFSCPVCKGFLDVRTGKFGEYFYCWGCNRNISKHQISRLFDS